MVQKVFDLNVDSLKKVGPDGFKINELNFKTLFFFLIFIFHNHPCNRISDSQLVCWRGTGVYANKRCEEKEVPFRVSSCLHFIFVVRSRV